MTNMSLAQKSKSSDIVVAIVEFDAQLGKLSDRSFVRRGEAFRLPRSAFVLHSDVVTDILNQTEGTTVSYR